MTSRKAVQSDMGEEQRTTAPTSEEIRQRAFEIHIERGGICGSGLDDWLQSERELLDKYESGRSVERSSQP